MSLNPDQQPSNAIRGISDIKKPRRRIIPAMRDPWHLPNQKIEIPAPTPLPPAPAPINLFTTALPPIIMVGGTIIFSLISGTVNWMLVGPMLVMSMGFPIANVLGTISSKKNYKKLIDQRQQAYILKLKEFRGDVAKLIQQQTRILKQAYPSCNDVLRIAQTRGALLWSRRLSDEDFLSLRIGETTGTPSFPIEAPRYLDPNDNLMELVTQTIQDCSRVPNIPALLPLSRYGSVAISGKLSTSVFGFARRLVFDLILHHSPQNVELAVLADSKDAVARWEWTKWLTHTDSLDGQSRIPHLCFDSHSIEKFMEYLALEYRNRRLRLDNLNQANNGTISTHKAIVVILDDSGTIRQNSDIALLADLGVTVGIHLIFVGGRVWPRECRSRVNLLDDRRFTLVETAIRDTIPMEGSYESVSLDDCLRTARSLGELEVGGALVNSPLPTSIRITEIIGQENLELASLCQKWQQVIPPKEQLQFPIGVRSQRDRLELASLNLLPEKADGHEVGGYDAYHTILIGTTGSGKSEFMKSMVIGAAMKYPPNLLNFFFLDFKGGAAFSVFETLPHVSGIVTNLSPDLVERGLSSIKNEIDRRQEEFALAKVRDIWTFNRSRPQQMPHLLLFLDEFARGLSDFPRLRETLDVLVRQGRSLGMYLILANQDVNSEVEKLLSNVGWRIALKVARPEEMLSMIARGLPVANRAGQGYLKRGDEIVEFQAGYAGQSVRNRSTVQTDEYTIYTVEPDGSNQKLFTKSNLTQIEIDIQPKEPSIQKEEDMVIDLLKQATEQQNIKPAARIYLDPLPTAIALEQIISDSGIPVKFHEGLWHEGNFPDRLVVPLGMLDIPRECRQEQLIVDFEDQDGHLWFVGAPGSGKEMALVSLISSISQSYTPSEVQFYILELGGGELRQFEGLPHTGAVIRPMGGEKERFERLLEFLDTELDIRINRMVDQDDERSKDPFIFLIINNFAELRANFPDEAEKFAHYVRDGRRARIHMIITTNRGPELSTSLRANIARRLVFQLGTKDEHIELVGRDLNVLQDKIEGRAYWIDGPALECQVGAIQYRIRDFILSLQTAWHGPIPRRIESLAPCISFKNFIEAADLKNQKATSIMIGKSYQDLNLIHFQMDEFSQVYLLIGPKESGKSNFMASIAVSIIETDPQKQWQIYYYSLRRNNFLNSISLEFPEILIFNTPETILENLKEIVEKMKSGSVSQGKRTIILFDDIGGVFQPGREAILGQLNTMSPLLENFPGVFLYGSSTLDEIRAQTMSPIIKQLKGGRVGMVLSKDNSELDFLGAQISLANRRIEMPLGRGYFINKGKPLLVQTPFLGDCIKTFK